MKSFLASTWHDLTRTLGVLSFLTALACSTAPREQVLRAEYECGTFHFSVAFRGDTAAVAVRGDTLHLPIAVSASGARYTDGTSTYWEHQGTALLELPDTSFSECVPIAV